VGDEGLARRARRSARPRPRPPAARDTPLPASLAGRALAERPVRRAPNAAGDGNAEEWLGAVRSALTPEPASPPPVQRVRLRYRKVGPARFIGTREIGNVFLRAARRARLPIAFSHGHHPMPRLSFSPAIPLGFSSDDEYVDVDLTVPTPPDAVAARLGAELPEGLEPVDAVDVPRTAPSIDAGIAAFVYEVDLTTLEIPPEPALVAAAVARFAASPSFPVLKRGKAGDRMVDARPFVRVLADAGPHRLRLELAVGPEGTVKPGAVVGALLDIPAAAVAQLRVHKVATRFRAAA
jgi:radical SAM-linked protein